AWTLVASALAVAAPSARAQDAGPAIARAHELEAEIEATVARTTPAYVVISGGSGVIVTADGFALTNHHVVATRTVGERWWVRRAGGERLRATLIGTDPRGDIAL